MENLGQKEVALKNPDNSKSGITFWEHIFVFRKYLFLMLFFVISFSIVSYFFNDLLFSILLKPLGKTELIFLSPIDPLTFLLKADFMAGLFLSFPIIAYLILKFVFPALGKKEKNVSISVFFCSFLLFVLSTLYAYYYLIPISIDFLLSIKIHGINNLITAQNYFNFVIFEILIMAMVFQIPLLLVMLAYTKIASPKLISSKRGYVYISLVVLISIITPTTDAISLGIIIVPVYLLFEIGLFLSRLVYRRRIN